MKRVLLAALVLLLAQSAVQAQTPSLGVGAYGGINIPLLQDDQASGTVFGFRGRVKVLPFLVAEPNVMLAKWGDPDAIDGVDLGIKGSKITGFGVDATVGGLPGAPGFKPFLVVGVGSFKIKNDDTGFDESNLGFKGGLGFGFGLTPKFDLDVRGALLVVPQEDGGSKKGALVTAGLSFNL